MPKIEYDVEREPLTWQGEPVGPYVEELLQRVREARADAQAALAELEMLLSVVIDRRVDVSINLASVMTTDDD